MPLSFAELTASLTTAEIQALLLRALQGVGNFGAVGAFGGAPVGTGSITYVSGVPNASYSVVIDILSTGEPGVGTFRYSVDGGTTYSSTVTLPSSGATYALGSTGVSIAFSSGPDGAGTSFVLGDSYRFSLAAPNFPVTAWQPGSVPRSLVAIDAEVLSDLYSLVAQVSAGGLLAYASGPWLDLLAWNVYALTRNAAVATRGTATLRDAGGAGPFTIAAGGMTIAATNGLRYTNVAGFTLPKSSTVDATWEAEAPGAAYNVGNGNITSIVAGNLPGVTVNNPDPGSGSWITTQGNDAETDAALRSRCQARWASLGSGPTAAVFDLWARTASASVTRTVVVADPVVAGQVNVYLAGPSGAVTGGDVTAVDTYIQQRVGLTNSAIVASATNVPVTVTATVTYESTQTTTSAIQAGITTNLTALFAQAPIGTDGAGTEKLYLDEIREAIMAVAGVRNAAPISSPSADVSLTTGQVPTLTLSFGSWTFTAL